MKELNVSEGVAIKVYLNISRGLAIILSLRVQIAMLRKLTNSKTCHLHVTSNDALI